MFRWYLGSQLLVPFVVLTLGLLACDALQPATTRTPTPEPSSTPTSPSPTLAPTATAQSDDPEPPPAYLTESYRGVKFESAEEWAEKVEEWERRRPESPGLSQWFRGFRVGLRTSLELNRDGGILNDKWKHCVVGFEVAQAASQGTAEYVAWRKEYQDLTDGRPGTSFEEEDYDATVDGALLLAQGETTASCDERWGDRNVAWDGISPPREVSSQVE